MATCLPRLKSVSSKASVIKSICVFCGSSEGSKPIYKQHATELGTSMAEKDYSLIYGGGSVGLMGTVTAAVLAAGGKAKGIMPEPMFRHGSPQICEVIIVPDMHTRKRIMGEQSDAFVVLPGGYGTMEEMLEVITWSQLGIHTKPIILLNTDGFFDLFVQWVEVSAKDKFIHESNKSIFVVCNTVPEIMQALEAYTVPEGRYALDWANVTDSEQAYKVYTPTNYSDI
ncbi:hypothetical protein BDF14DRAFT_1863014 [Spinellus fusiger]|nr:hypothetical protein BDF14DRAFT_1863014 [Spinellus fusiger]